MGAIPYFRTCSFQENIIAVSLNVDAYRYILLELKTPSGLVIQISIFTVILSLRSMCLLAYDLRKMKRKVLLGKLLLKSWGDAHRVARAKYPLTNISL